MADIKDYKKTLAFMVETAGLYLQSNSEDIVGKLDLTNDFSINIDFMDYDGILYRTPKVSIQHTVFAKEPI